MPSPRPTHRPRIAPAIALALGLAGCHRAPPPPPADAGVAAAPAAPAASAVVVSAASSLAAEAGAPVAAEAQVDGASLRAAHRARIAADRSPVSLLRGDDPVLLGARVCEATVPRRPAQTPVLVKPNIGGIEWFKDPLTHAGDDGIVGRTTDPEFVRGVVRCLKARGHRTITIAEGFAHAHADWERLVRTSGYEAMAREEGVRLVALDDDGVFDVKGDQPGKPLAVRGIDDTQVPTLLVPKILAEHLEHGLFLSVPKLKAHRFGVISVGLKGMQGVVMYSDARPAFHQKWRSHRELSAALEAAKRGDPDARAAYVRALEVFAERMTDVLEIAAPDAVLAEGTPAMGGDGFGQQWPVAERVAIGGTNPVAVDRVAAQFLGLWDSEPLARELLGHRTSPLIESAARRFGVDLAAVKVEGDGAALLATPRPYHLVGMGGFALHSDDSPATPPSRARGDAGAAALEDAGAGRPELHARRAAEPPVIDGRANDAAWGAATPVQFDTDWRGEPTGTVTTVRAAWSPEALYLLFETQGAGLFTDTARPVTVEREKLYQEDCVEVMLSPDPQRPTRYYEVELGPYGHFLDIDVDRAAKTSDTGWSSRPEIATRRSAPDRTATIEVALRAPGITEALARGRRLPLALYRMEGRSPRLYLAWSPTRTPRPDFHVPAAFGTLVLE